MKYINRFVGLESDVTEPHGLVSSVLDAIATEYEAAGQYLVLMNALSELGRPDLARVVMHIFKEELEHAGELASVADSIMGAVTRRMFEAGYEEAKKMVSGFKPKD